MSRETLEKDIKNSIANLVRLVEKECWNKLSANFSFILSDFNEFKRKNFYELTRSKVEINNKKVPQSLETIIKILRTEYSDLYDIILYVFKAKKSETIIEIEYFRKSNFEPDYLKKVKNNPPMFHSKISMPRYWKGGKNIDINWHFGGLKHTLNLFVYDFNNRKIIQETKRKNRP